MEFAITCRVFFPLARSVIDRIPVMGKKTWSAADDTELRRLYRELAPESRLGEISGLTGRTPGSVRHRASRLGIADLHHPGPRGERNKRWSGGREAARERVAAKGEAERRARGATQQQPWSEAEDRYLTSAYATMSLREIAKVMGRSFGSVHGRAGRLGIKGRGQGNGQQRGEKSHNWKGGKTASSRRKMYHLEPEEFDSLLESQGDRCAICLRSKAEITTKRVFHVDHDHETGRIRGVLCGRCNLMLGHAKDRADTLLRAVDYLERNRQATAA